MNLRFHLGAEIETIYDVINKLHKICHIQDIIQDNLNLIPNLHMHGDFFAVVV